MTEQLGSTVFQRALVEVAVGFGLGRIKPAPGTWGSLLGLPLAFGLSQVERPIGVAIWAVLVVVGVIACNAAAAHYGRKDPGECVVDEYVALAGIALVMPLGMLDLLLAFGLFRLFDIWKPWPIKQFERLPAGWGIMADDVVAAGYATGVLWALMRLAN